MRPLLLPSILGLALLTAACASSGPPQRFRGHGQGMRRHGPTGPGMGMGPRLSLFVSPAGKPFRGAPGQPAPIDNAVGLMNEIYNMLLSVQRALDERVPPPPSPTARRTAASMRSRSSPATACSARASRWASARR